MMQRRDFFHLPTLALGAAALPAWAKAPVSRGQCTYNVVDFGAKGDGKTLNTAAIQAAMDAATANGGGEVCVPAGTFLTGVVRLRSNITLHLFAGATLLGTPHVEDYSPLGGGAKNSDNGDRHLIFAHKAENISIIGEGTIDGNGQAFWEPTGSPKPKPENLWRAVISGEWRAKPTGRISPMIELASCRRVRVTGVTLQNSSGWTLRPIDCDMVEIHGIVIRNPIYGPNTDGIDLTASRNVIISNCDINTGDDAIVLKSLNPYGPIGLCANITITNCVLSGCSNGLKIGTETHAAFENIVFTNSVIQNEDVPLNERIISGVAVEMVDGSTLDGVVVSNIRMKNVRTPIFVRLETRTEAAAGAPATALRNITISNIDAAGSILTSSITGLPGHPVQNITIENVRLSSVEHGNEAWADNELPERPNAYPESRMFGRLPAHGLYIRHAERVRIRAAEFLTAGGDGRPAVVCDEVNDLVLSGVEASQPAGHRAMFVLRDCQNAFINACRAPLGSAVFLQIAGAKSQRIVLVGNDSGGETEGVHKAADVPRDAVVSS